MDSRGNVMHVAFVNAHNFLSGARFCRWCPPRSRLPLEAYIFEHSVNESAKSLKWKVGSINCFLRTVPHVRNAQGRDAWVAAAMSCMLHS